jgi:hemerythrin-like domain-containing protein
MKATRLLKEEHQYILRALGVMDELAVRVADGSELDEHDVESMLQFLRVFGDDHHQEKEEFILFPALLKASHAEEHECLCQITFEHNQQRSVLEGIEDALKSHRGQDFVYYAKRLGELVRAHIQEEEDGVFKRADAILSAEVDERIAQELAAYDSPGRVERLNAVLKRLIMLELKYGIHPNTAVERPHYA